MKTEQSQQKPEMYLRAYIKVHKLRTLRLGICTKHRSPLQFLTGAQQVIGIGDLDLYSKRHS